MNTPTEVVVSTLPFTVRRYVRWGECDPAGVVYTGRFTDYLISAVTLFHEHLMGAFAEICRKRLGSETPCKGLTLTSHHALRPNEVFDMHASVGQIRISSYDIHLKATLSDRTPMLAGSFGPICLPSDSRPSLPIPLDLHQRLQAARTPI